MNIKISFRNMEHSDALTNYTNEALEKVFKFIEREPEPIHIDVILEAHKIHAHHKVEIRMSSKHYHFLREQESPDIYQAIDYLIKVLIEDIKKTKGKNLDKREKGHIKPGCC